MKTIFLALVLAQQPLAPDAVAPPNHPPMNPAPSGELPPNHPPLDGQQPRSAPSSDELMKRLDAANGLKDKDKPFEVAVSLGRLYFSHARYAEAVTFYDQAVTKADPARKFYLEKKKAAGKTPMPPAEKAGCVPEATPNLEKQLGVAKAKTKPEEAATCARTALHPLIEVESQLASAKFLTQDKAGALAVYDRALELFPSNAEARYGRAALLLDFKGDDAAALKLAKADLDQFLNDYPTSPHAKQAKAFLSRVNDAIAAGGISKLAAMPAKRAPEPAASALPPDHPGLGQQAGSSALPEQPRDQARPAPLSPEMMQAMQNVEVTEDMKKGFEASIAAAEDQLAKGQFQDALNNYKTVMPFQPDGRVRAGMAWSLIGLNRQPMADNIWNVAAQDPAAVDALGDALARKGDSAGAQRLWAKLRDTVPSYAPKLAGKIK